MGANITHHDMDMLLHGADALRLSLLDVHTLAVRKLAGTILLNASMHMTLTTFFVALNRVPHGVVIDTDDALDKTLMDVMGRVIEARNEALALRTGFRGLRYMMVKAMLGVLVQQLGRLYVRAEALRRFVLEHDADAAPRGAVYDSADALISHLRLH